VVAVRPGFLVALVGALVLAVGSFAFTSASRARAQRAGDPPASAASGAADPAGAPADGRDLHPLPEVRARADAAPAPRHHRHVAAPSTVLRVRDGRSVALRDRPHGHVIATVGDRTEFGSPTALSVAARRGHWVGVPSPALGNGRLGWVDAHSGSLDRRTTDVKLTVSLAHRRLELRLRGRVKRRVSVAIGRPGSTTPRGRFSITDKLAGSRYGPYYGCCILALSGHQPHPPPGWTGGSRLAIHGTNAPSTIGTPASAGCLRAADRDLQVLMRRVPLGTPVLIRG
jgi:lipoprotein-anchoring transpeptidase ErfK/SrfK